MRREQRTLRCPGANSLPVPPLDRVRAARDKQGVLDGEETERDPKARPSTSTGPGALFGRFLILSEVGSGAFGQVFSAFDPQLDRKVALKVLRGQGDDEYCGSQPSENSASLVREARALAKFTHPNVVTVYEAGSEGNRAFIAMELVEGNDLGSWLQEHKTDSWSAKLEMLLQAGDGLAAAHAEGTVHRDFKPANVLVGTDGRARVGDFGLATNFARDLRSPTDARETDPPTPPSIVGTPYYMAPELFDGSTGDERSDLYAYGLTAFEALYAVRLFDTETLATLVFAKSKEPTLPSDSHGIPTGIARALARAFATDPTKRWPTVTALQDELRRIASPKPRLVRTAVLSVAAAGLLAGGTYAVADHLQTGQLVDHCNSVGARFADVWTTEMRRGVDDGLIATQARYAASTRDAVLPILDTYAADISKTAVEACLASTVEASLPSALWEASQACLEERARHLRGTAELLSHASEPILRSSLGTATSLPTPAACADPAHLSRRVENDLNDDPAALRTLISAEFALRNGREAQALADLEQLHAELTLDDTAPPTVLAALGRAELAVGRLDDAREHGKQSYRAARAQDNIPVAIVAATLMTSVEAFASNRFDVAELWADLALADLDQLEEPTLSLRRVPVHESLAQAALRNGKLELAVDQWRRVHEILHALLDPGDPRVALSSIELASALRGTGEDEASSHRFDTGLDQLRTILGSEHPDVAQALEAQARLYSRGGDAKKALELDSEALTIREAAYGEEHTIVARSHYYVGVSLMQKHENEEAIRALRRALDMALRVAPEMTSTILTYRGGLALALGQAGQIDATLEQLLQVLEVRRSTLSPTHPKVGVVESQLAFYFTEAGQHTAALEHGLESLRIHELAHGPDHPYVAFPLESLSRANYALGRWPEALSQAERAWKVRAGATITPSLRADSSFSLAKVLWDAPISAGRDRPRALQLVRDTAKDLNDDELRATATAWLAAREAPDSRLVPVSP